MSKELIEKLREDGKFLGGNFGKLMHEAADALETKAAPVGEREAFETWFNKEKLPSVSYGNPNILKKPLWPAFQAGAAPRQPEGEEIAWSLRSDVAGCGLVRYMTDSKYQAQTQAIKQWYEPFRCQQCTDAQRAIAYRDATIERLEAGIPRLQEQSFQMRQQRDKLAGLLRDVRPIVALEVERWARAAAILPVNANVESGLLARIDAALAEVDKQP